MPYYRRHNSETGLSIWGHAQFTTDMDYAAGFDGNWFTVDEAALTPAENLRDAFTIALETCGEPDEYADADNFEDFFSWFADPWQTENGALAWDNGNLVEWFRDYVNADGAIKGISVPGGLFLTKNALSGII